MKPPYIKNQPIARILWALMCLLWFFIAVFDMTIMTFTINPIYWIFTGEDRSFELTSSFGKYMDRFYAINC